jgi:D-proline reductase (dithiol) PrdB
MALQSFMSRKCVPYTPVTSPLKELTVALVSSSGVYMEGQEPFTENGDESYRVIPAEAEVAQLRFKHGHYDTSDAEKDPNVVFPLGLLHDLAKEGFIKKVSNTDLKAQYERLAPAIAHEIERSQADAVVLTGG